MDGRSFMLKTQRSPFLTMAAGGGTAPAKRSPFSPNRRGRQIPNGGGSCVGREGTIKEKWHEGQVAADTCLSKSRTPKSTIG